MNGRWTRALLYIPLLLCMFCPTYASLPFKQEDVMLVYRAVFMQTSTAYLRFSPLIHGATLILILALYRYGSKLSRLADAYFGLLFVFLAFSNHIAVTDEYGFVVMTGNIVQISLVGLVWLWSAFTAPTDYVFPRLPAWRYWVIPLAVFAFWSPINPDLSPNFSPLLLLTSSFGVMFCPTTPVVIALLTLSYPQVNREVIGVTSVVGFLFGLFNAMAFLLMPGYSLWNFVLHIPLIATSLYGLVIPWIVKNP